jgi:hypothetical protein
MNPEEEEMLLFHSLVGFPEHFPADDAAPGSGIMRTCKPAEFFSESDHNVLLIIA